MELRRKLQQEGAAAAVRDAAMRLSAASSTAYNPGTGAAGSSWLTATADGAITLAAQLALDALEGKHDAGASGGAALANSEKKNSPQGVATDMQLIDAAPRAHAFIAYAGAGGFDLAESLHALLVPAMYSSVVADADGPPLNGAKEKGGAKAADVWASGADLPMAMCGCDLFIAALGDGALKSERMVKLLDAAASCGMRVALVRPDGAAEPVPADVAAAAADGALGAAAVSWLLSAGAAAAAGAVALPTPPAPRPPGSDNPFEKKKDDKNAPKPTAPAPPPLLSYDEADVQPLRHELERLVLAQRRRLLLSLIHI